MPYIATNTTRLGHMTESAFTAVSTSAGSPPFPVLVVVAIIAMLSVALAMYTYAHETHTVPADDKEAQVYELSVLGSRTAREPVDNRCAGKIHPRAMSLDSVYSASTFRTSVHLIDDNHLQELRAHSPSPSSTSPVSALSSVSANVDRVCIEPLSQDEQDITQAGASFGPGTYSLRAYEGRNRPRPTRTRVCTPPLQLFATAA
ncbi:hypothetical protein EXIGLDRAFT_770620 [Exidia glandulosa HHB12029]|uniref:Uncharacterized protein n=1 Tax=Exidia glandulosa HHB12029 TaxID=1314781 RepID=A0A165GKG7_EXIGL|nr:hypothetical protein EXIGLDRAFT_770620 [Exidia glandulosa HHB12029]